VESSIGSVHPYLRSESPSLAWIHGLTRTHFFLPHYGVYYRILYYKSSESTGYFVPRTYPPASARRASPARLLRRESFARRGQHACSMGEISPVDRHEAEPRVGSRSRSSTDVQPGKSLDGVLDETLEELGRCSNFAPQSSPRRQDELDRIRQRVVTAASRGAIMGMTMRGGFHVLSYALRLVVQNDPKRSKGVVVTTQGVKDVVRKIIKDTIKYGMFLGSFSGGFVALDEGIALGLGREKTTSWRALASGLLAGSSLIFAGKDTRHTSLSLFVFLKGLTFLIRCGNVPLVVRGGQERGEEYPRRAWVRKILAPTRLRHGDMIIMCLAMSQLGYSWIVLPSTLPRSMLNFLNKHGGQSNQVMGEIRKMCNLPRPGRIPCQIVHPGQTCNEHALGFFPQAYARAIPVYLPVYIVPALLIHRQKLLSDPEIWPKIIKGTLRSSLFLSLFCTFAWRSVCMAFQMHRRASGTIIASSCWMAGLALIAEKKSRRMDLSVYALSRALESFGLCLAAWGVVTAPKLRYMPRADVALFSMAAAAICHCYSDHNGQRRDVFAGKYLNFFDFIFGNTGFDNKGRIRHVPTNRDLVAMAGNRVKRLTKSLGQDVASLSRTVSSVDETDDENESFFGSSSSSDDLEL
jgi:hypothetical protein